MKAVVLRSGRGQISVEEIPAPQVTRGRLLIRNQYSLISAGTERMTVQGSQQSLVEKALSRPDQTRRVLQSVRELGPRDTYRMVTDHLDAPTLLGYSSAGTVIEVGDGCDDISPGMLVAAGGQGHAAHAEIISVPKNLCSPVPDGVPARSAAFATVGAIALQGIHQAGVEPGSRVAVIGLGLVGQLTVRVLDQYGYQVVGVDRDLRMLGLAANGGVAAIARDDEDVPSAVRRLWGGCGADAVIVTAGTESADPVELAGALARDRAVVVIVGAVNVAPPRPSYFGKELSIRYSRSYGPGRYDPLYEEAGISYPEGYVPWPERRNLEEFLRLVHRGLELESLQPVVFPISDALSAYKLLDANGDERRVAILLSHGSPDDEPASEAGSISLRADRPAPRRSGRIRIAAIGAGSFPTRMLFPHLARDRDVDFSWIATGGGLTAVHQGRRWGFEEAVANLDEGLKRVDTDCVMVLSRHDTHSTYSARVLESGMNLFCEKPLALSEQELETVAGAWLGTGASAMVGFNRRFAPAVRELKDALGDRRPVQLLYRVFAGVLPADHWYFDRHQGGRILGEVCHFVDTADFLVGRPPIWVSACSGDGRSDPIMAQSVSVQLGYSDGSTASIVYAGQTLPGAPKELLELAADGLAARVEDFSSLTLWQRAKTVYNYGGGDKGHREEMAALVRRLRGKPIGADDFVASLWSTLATIRTADALRCGQRLDVAPVTPALSQALGSPAPVIAEDRETS